MTLGVKTWIKHCFPSLFLFLGKISPALQFFRDSSLTTQKTIKNLKIRVIKTHIKHKSQRQVIGPSTSESIQDSSMFLPWHHQCPYYHQVRSFSQMATRLSGLHLNSTGWGKWQKGYIFNWVGFFKKTSRMSNTALLFTLH